MTSNSGASTASGSSSTRSGTSSGSGSGSGSGSSSGGSTYGMTYSVATLDDDSDTAVAVDDNYCKYNATETEATGCKKPRGCRACLRVTGCMIDSNAQCVSAADHYNESLDFRAAKLYTNASLGMKSSLDYWNTSGAYSTAVQNWIFPATMINYCTENETSCELCRISIFANTSAVGGDMRFCVGANGCVCTAMCDSPYHEEQIRNQTVCDPAKRPKKVPAALMWVVGSAMAIVICLGLYYWIWKRTGSDTNDADDDSRVDIDFSKDCASKPEPTPSHAPHLPDTPIMELSVNEFPRFSIDSSRRQGRFVVE